MKTMDNYFLSAGECALVIIDIQERLAAVMEERGKVVANTRHLIELAKTFDMPVIVTEQYPKGLGRTVTEVAQVLERHARVEKMAFDCCGEETYVRALEASARRKLIVAGMETHVCVLQTVLSLLNRGFCVHAVSDAICSRDRENKRIALDMMASAGAVVTCAETVLFQVMKVAGTPEFKRISSLIK